MATTVAALLDLPEGKLTSFEALYDDASLGNLQGFSGFIRRKLEQTAGIMPGGFTENAVSPTDSQGREALAQFQQNMTAATMAARGGKEAQVRQTLTAIEDLADIQARGGLTAVRAQEVRDEILARQQGVAALVENIYHLDKITKQFAASISQRDGTPLGELIPFGTEIGTDRRTTNLNSDQITDLDRASGLRPQ